MPKLIVASAERHHERRDVEHRDADAVDDADEGAGADAGEDAQGQVRARLRQGGRRGAAPWSARVTTEVMATILPTERSKPPVSSASICPMATMAR